MRDQCLARRRALLDTAANRLIAHARTASQQTHDTLRAWVEPPDFDALQASARSSAAATARGLAGALSGVPVGIKDVIDAAGMPTRAGSQSRASAPPADRNAVVVQQLVDQGAIVAGKTATTEFAYLDPPPTTNPFNPAHTPGGSSSGSAAIVGAGVVPLALGTQTAGSVCRPAAFCGTFAYKPSTGRTAPEGVTPFAMSFDTVGVMGLDVDLVLTAGELLIGPPASARHRPAAAGNDAAKISGLRIGLIDDPYYRTVTADCQQQLDRVQELLMDAGSRFDAITLGLDFIELRAMHRLMMHVEAHRAHPRLLEDFGTVLRPHWKSALERGAATSDTDYRRATEALRNARTAMLAKLQEFDLVLVPPVFGPAPRSIEATGDAGLIVPWTYLGSPLVVMPTALSADGLPLAVMFAGLPGSDAATIGACRAIGALLRQQGAVIDRPT